MYRVEYNGTVIFDDTNVTTETALEEPQLSLAENTAGSLTFVLPPQHAAYASIPSFGGIVTVYKNDAWFWEGRILGETKDFWNRRTITCEGALAFLNDTTQPHHDYGNYTVQGFLNSLLTVHNTAKANESAQQIYIGTVSVTDSGGLIEYRTNYENTMTYVSDMVSKLGGHLRLRRQTSNNVSKLYLDYLADYIQPSDTQVIRFGENLLENFTREWDNSEFATVVVPLGAKLESEDEDEFEDYLTVKDASRGDGSIYVKNNAAIVNYGRIEKLIRFDDVTDPDVLYSLAEYYLSNIQFQSLVIELSAVDLNMLDVSYASFNLLDNLLVESEPHGMSGRYPLTKIDIPLDTPENTTYTLGNKTKMSLSAMSNSVSDEVRKEINSLIIPSKSEILALAKENATQIISNATTGYITIVQSSPDPTTGATHAQELIISSTKNYSSSTGYWRWNSGGLAYFKNGTAQVAMDMTGAIVADRVTTGTLHVGSDVILEGPLISSNKYMLRVYTDSSGQTPVSKVEINGATIEIDSSNGKNRIYLDPTNGIKIQKKNGSSWTNVFYVDSSGNLLFAGNLSGATGTFSGQLSAATGTFSGQLSAATGTFNGDISAASGNFSGTLNIGNGNFVVDANGRVTMKGAFNKITTPEFYGSSGTGSTYVKIVPNGFRIYANDSATNPSLELGANSSSSTGWTHPYLQLGIGSGTASGGIIIKMTNGLWVGTNQSGGTQPSGGTGLWIDFTDNKLYRYNNGTKTEITSGGGTATAVFG